MRRCRIRIFSRQILNNSAHTLLALTAPVLMAAANRCDHPSAGQLLVFHLDRNFSPYLGAEMLPMLHIVTAHYNHPNNVGNSIIFRAILRVNTKGGR